MSPRKYIMAAMVNLIILGFFSHPLLGDTTVGRRFRVHHRNSGGPDATNLHFNAYQTERRVWIKSANIDVRGLGGATINQPIPPPVPHDNDQGDGKTHGYNVSVTGNIPHCEKVEIDVEFTLNKYNTIRIKDGEWTYASDPPRKIPNHGFKVKKRWKTGVTQEMVYIFHNDDPDYRCEIDSLKFYLGGASISLDGLETWPNWETFGTFPVTVQPLDSLIIPMDTISVGDFLYFRGVYSFTSQRRSQPDTVDVDDLGYHEEQEAEPSQDCTQVSSLDDPGPAYRLDVVYTGAGGTIRDDVAIVTNPAGCGSPFVEVIGGNAIRLTWPQACVDQGEAVEYDFTVAYPCEEIQPPSIIWWSNLHDVPALTEWGMVVLVVLILLSAWVVVRRKKTVLSRQ